MPKQFDLSGTKITAAEISRNFGHWQDIAMQYPVLVTHHGRPRVVLMSAAEYFKLRARDDAAESAFEFDHGLDGVSTLSAHMQEGFVWLDADLRVRALNSVAAANMGLDMDAALALDFEALAQRNEGMGVVVSWLRRALRTSEPVRFEMTGVTGSGRSYSVCAFPFRGGVAYTFMQETEVRELRRLAGHWRAELDAINELCEIATLRVSPTGFIEESNEFLRDLLGFSASELSLTRLIDIVVEPDREETATALAAVLSGTSPRFVGVFSLMLKARGATRLKVSCSPIRQDGVCTAITIVGVEV